MGRVASKISKPARSFNIENRARRALEKQHEKGVAAPKHPSTKDHIAEIQRDHPEYLAEQQVRNEALHEKLKGLYVEGQQSPQLMEKKQPKPLPESRWAKDETEFGSMETFHTIPEGRANLKTIVGFLTLHQVNPDQVTAQSIAQDYRLDEKDVEKLLLYYKSMRFHIPQELYDKNPELKKMIEKQMSSPATSVPQFQFSLPEDPKVNSSKSGSDKT